MPLSREQIQATLLKRDNSEDNPWTVWYGTTKDTAVQLVNKDDSNPYVRQENVSPEMMAYDETINIQTEIYRVTWVQPQVSDKPNSSANWWLSYDNGATKDKVTFVNKKSKTKRAFWWIYLKKG